MATQLKLATKITKPVVARSPKMLRAMAQKVYSDRPELQAKWLKAAQYLNQSKKGWAIDKIVTKDPEQRVL
jgi:hypothetical protein